MINLRLAAQVQESTDDSNSLARKIWGSYLIVCGAIGSLLIAVTWRLWTPQELFPQVPLMRLFSADATEHVWFQGLAWTSLLVMLCGLLAMALFGIKLAFFSDDSRSLRKSVLLWVMGWAMLVLIDQHRLQPWAVQLSVIVVLAATLRAENALRYVRWLVLGIYFWSAVGKLDVQFVRTVGTQFVEQLLAFMAVPTGDLDPHWAAKLALAFPLGELLVVGLLFFSRTRRIGVVAAVVMHCVLLFVLGPWGLDHEPGVLLWNVLFLLQAWLLFWQVQDGQASVREPSDGNPRLGPLLVLGMLLAPIGERAGYVDHWLAWALYAPHSSRAVVFVRASDRDRLPESLRGLLGDPSGTGDTTQKVQPWDWVRVPIEQWSLKTLGVPIYPQGRFQLGVATSVAEQAKLDRNIRVELRSVAQRRTGERKTQVLSGLDDLHRATELFWLNSRPL